MMGKSENLLNMTSFSCFQLKQKSFQKKKKITSTEKKLDLLLNPVVFILSYQSTAIALCFICAFNDFKHKKSPKIYLGLFHAL